MNDWGPLIKSINAEQNMYSISKKFPANTNTNIIRFEKIDRIRIRILFGLKKSPEYKYEYLYLASIIRIIFKYQIICQSELSASHEVHHDIIHGVPHTNVIRFEERS